jgi:hypothetical protein
MGSSAGIRTAGSPAALSSFDLAGISRSIDSAVASLKPEEHGALTAQLTQDGLSVGFVARGPQVGPVKSSVLVTVSKPMAGPLTWGASARVSFLVGQPRPQEPGMFAAFRGARLVLKTWVPEPWATAKAALLCFGFRVKFKEA